MSKILNVYDNHRTPKIKNTIPIEEWFNLIKKSDYSSLIQSARPFGRGIPAYDNVKASIPAVTYNFLFDDYKENKNICGATGFLYFDIDKDNFDINQLDIAKIFAYYNSFGGNGYSIIVQVKDLTLSNFNATYSFILADLGLTQYYDKDAQKATQFNVLSYDPNIFINNNSIVYESQNVSLSNVIKEEKKTYISGRGTQVYNHAGIRFDNLDEIEIIGKYAFNWNGWQYVRCWLPYNKKIKAGNRNKSLISYCNNLVWLNPHLTDSGAFAILNKVNPQMCEEPLPVSQVKSIVSSIFKYKEQGSLNPIYNRKPRKIIFAPHTGLSAKQKLAICRDLLIDKKQNDSLQKIDSTIESWDFGNGKITIRAVAKTASMSLKTVTKYWSEFKETAKILNDDFKSATTLNVLSLSKTTPQSGINELQETKEMDVVLTDLRIDDTNSFYVANYSQYSRAIALITATSKVMMRLRLKHLITQGFNGEEILMTDDFEYKFVIHPSVNTVEFKNVA